MLETPEQTSKIQRTRGHGGHDDHDVCRTAQRRRHRALEPRFQLPSAAGACAPGAQPCRTWRAAELLTTASQSKEAESLCDFATYTMV